MTKIEAIAVGNELLSGDLADAHVQRFGAFLRERGLGLSRSQTVPDDLDAIGDAISQAARRADVVLVTGGLGSTSDDLTVDAVVALLGVERVEDGPSVEHIRRRSTALSRTPTAAQLEQAWIPSGSEALFNRAGSAPGIQLTYHEATVFLFPGVPVELEALMADHLAPWVDQALPIRPLQSAVFKTFGDTESGIATRLEGVDWEAAHVAYRATFPEVHITLYVQDGNPDEAKERLDRLSTRVRERLAGVLFGEGAAASFPAAIGGACAASGLTLAVAESCTGGLLAQSLTAVSGASAWFLEGVVTYSDEAKTSLLDVPAELIRSHGAVSEAVACAMANAIRARSGADIGVGITGIAGPTGGTPDKPVGTVHVAVAGENGVTHRRLQLPFDRLRNRHASAWKALQMIGRMCAVTNT
jgi:nicotinamide-nucleotide amidase